MHIDRKQEGLDLPGRNRGTLKAWWEGSKKERGEEK